MMTLICSLILVMREIQAPLVSCAAVVGATVRGAAAYLAATTPYQTSGATISVFGFPSVHKNRKNINKILSFFGSGRSGLKPPPEPKKMNGGKK